jgi:hypothetical protein
MKHIVLEWCEPRPERLFEYYMNDESFISTDHIQMALCACAYSAVLYKKAEFIQYLQGKGHLTRPIVNVIIIESIRSDDLPFMQLVCAAPDVMRMLISEPQGYFEWSAKHSASIHKFIVNSHPIAAQ